MWEQSQKEPFKVILRKQLKGLLQGTMRLHLWVKTKEQQHTGKSFYIRK